MSHKVELKSITQLTHDVHQYVFTRPEAYDFVPGQATELALDRDGWRDEGRPFTFTCQPEDSDLEFVIKSYPDHHGVTEQLPTLSPGDPVQIDDPFGAITDQGKGVFLAAGAGVTPFIPILRKRAREGAIEGCSLIFSNKTEADIILRDEWTSMAGLHCVFVVTDEKASDLHQAQIDREFLKRTIPHFDQKFYLCGPGGFVNDLRDALKSLGAKDEDIVTEDGW